MTSQIKMILLFFLFLLLHGKAPRGMTLEWMDNNMMRWSINNVPTITPATLSAFSFLINSDSWKHLRSYDGGVLEFNIIHGQNSESILIMDPEFSKLLLTECDLYLHVTENCTPSIPGCKQLITLMSLQDNYVIPCAWGIMKDDSFESYKDLLQTIKTLIPNFTINNAVTNFSKNLNLSINAVFPNASVTGSFFYYQQEVMKLAMLCNVDSYLEENAENEVKNLLFSVLSLPLLPPENIEQTFKQLTDNIGEEASAHCQLFLFHFNKLWLEGVKSNNFSIFKCIHLATNVFQVYESQLLVTIGSHSLIWKFIRKIFTLQLQVVRDYRRIIGGTRSGLRVPKLLDTHYYKIRPLWSEFQLKSLSVQNYLKMCSAVIAAPSFLYFIHSLAEVGNIEPLELISCQLNDMSLVGTHGGLPNASEVNKENDAVANKKPECCICLEAAPTECFEPCMHLAACLQCLTTYTSRHKNKTCPICRCIFRSTVRVFCFGIS